MRVPGRDGYYTCPHLIHGGLIGVRRHPSLAAMAVRGASAFLPHYRSESRDRLQMLQVVQIVAGERLDDPLDRDLTK